MKIKHLSLLLALFPFIIISCLRSVTGHSQISFQNESGVNVGVCWTFEESTSLLSWYLSNYSHLDYSIVESNSINKSAITLRYPAVFEDNYIHKDTMYIYLLKQNDIELFLNNIISCIDYTCYKYTLEQMQNNNWTIRYPAINEDAYVFDSTYEIVL